MNIIIRTRRCDIGDKLRQEAEERTGHATRIFDRLGDIEVMFVEERNPRIPDPAKVEITTRAKGTLIRAEGSSDEHRAALDQAIDRFERQLRRYKTRQVDKRRNHTRGAGDPVPQAAEVATLPSEPVEPDEPAAGEGEGPRIVRTKRFELTPMLPEEAALQLELLGHDFFVFENSGTGAQNVIYRRRDGDLGLIEPEA